jgi:hypothetical protein
MVQKVMLVCLAMSLAGCKGKENASSSAGGTLVPPVASASASATPAPPPKSPKDLLDDYQRTLADAVDEGRYGDVCKGSPWFPSSICQWVATRAQGKPVERPDSDVYRNLFEREHWKHVYGTIIDDAADEGDYEVAVGGYRNHCLLDTEDTKFTTKGRFNLWVQEQPETREVTVNSGKTANWVVLSEMPLAKSLMDLAHSGVSLESTGIAKDAIKLIAQYDTYAVLKGTIPSIPGITAAAKLASDAGSLTTAIGK